MIAGPDAVQSPQIFGPAISAELPRRRRAEGRVDFLAPPESHRTRNPQQAIRPPNGSSGRSRREPGTAPGATAEAGPQLFRRCLAPAPQQQSTGTAAAGTPVSPAPVCRGLVRRPVLQGGGAEGPRPRRGQRRPGTANAPWNTNSAAHVLLPWIHNFGGMGVLSPRWFLRNLRSEARAVLGGRRARSLAHAGSFGTSGLKPGPSSEDGARGPCPRWFLRNLRSEARAVLVGRRARSLPCRWHLGVRVRKTAQPPNTKRKGAETRRGLCRRLVQRQGQGQLQEPAAASGSAAVAVPVHRGGRGRDRRHGGPTAAPASGLLDGHVSAFPNGRPTLHREQPIGESGRPSCPEGSLDAGQHRPRLSGDTAERRWYLRPGRCRQPPPSWPPGLAPCW